MQREKLQPAGETLQFMQRMWDFVHALDVRSKRMMQSLGVTGPQRLVIRLLGQKPGQTASDIASILGKHPSTLTGVLARLEARHLIVREIDPADRRRARFKLTPGGKKINKESKGTVEAATRRALGRVSPTSIETTLDLVGKLVEELVRDE
jgi:MarR family transcriptional regulator, organic hydroperoxide resistance regulator